jgi:hypothetical protein
MPPNATAICPAFTGFFMNIVHFYAYKLKNDIHFTANACNNFDKFYFFCYSGLPPAFPVTIF